MLPQEVNRFLRSLPGHTLRRVTSLPRVVRLRVDAVFTAEITVLRQLHRNLGQLACKKDAEVIRVNMPYLFYVALSGKITLLLQHIHLSWRR